MIGRDIRYFLRTLGRQPGFALTVILSLAVGIGANTVMFGVAKTILLERLAARDPDSLVLLQWSAPDFPAESLSGNVSFDGPAATSTSFSNPAYETFSRNARSIGSIIAFSSIDRLNVSMQGQPTIARMLVDLLALRRALFVDVIRLVATRIQPGGTAPARAALDRAWALKDAGQAFQREDFQVIRAVAEAAGLLPALWVLNRISGVYLEVAESLSGAFKPPADYHASHSKFLDAIDRGDGDLACATINDYLERHDRSLVSALEMFV